MDPLSSHDDLSLQGAPALPVLVDVWGLSWIVERIGDILGNKIENAERNANAIIRMIAHG